MMPFQQPPTELDGRHAVRFGDAIALLDVAGDAYSCFYDPADHAGACPLPDLRSIARETARTSAIEQAFQQWRTLPDAHAKLRLRDVRRFTAALSVAVIQFRRRDFAALLRGSGGDGFTCPGLSPDELAAVIACFERMVLFLPVPILCLFRSFFLRRFLSFYGCTADWVFGVTLFPFRAHCWLASGDLLLGESADRAVQFSPILVVRAERP